MDREALDNSGDRIFKTDFALHDALKPLSWLLGTWISDSGQGRYPTIKPFNYAEKVEFTHVGQPMLNYKSSAWDPQTEKPMHLECGFLRILPKTNQVAFMVSHNFGVCTVEEGEINDEELKLSSTSVSRMSFSKQPAVTKITRNYKRTSPSSLEYTMCMETSNQPLQEHLKMMYIKKAN